MLFTLPCISVSTERNGVSISCSKAVERFWHLKQQDPRRPIQVHEFPDWVNLPARCVPSHPWTFSPFLQPWVFWDTSSPPAVCRRKHNPRDPYVLHFDTCQCLSSRRQQSTPAAHAAHDPPPGRLKLSSTSCTLCPGWGRFSWIRCSVSLPVTIFDLPGPRWDECQLSRAVVLQAFRLVE